MSVERVNGCLGHVFKIESPPAEPSAINAITKANPGEVTTTSAHGLVTGDSVRITAVVGMTEVNGVTFTVTKVNATKFTLGVNTSTYTTYISGGTVTPLGVEVFIKSWDATISVSTSDATSNAAAGFTDVTVGNKTMKGTVACLYDQAKAVDAQPIDLEAGDLVTLHLFPHDELGGYYNVPVVITETPIKVADDNTVAWSFSFQNKGAWAWVPAAA